MIPKIAKSGNSVYNYVIVNVRIPMVWQPGGSHAESKSLVPASSNLKNPLSVLILTRRSTPYPPSCTAVQPPSDAVKNDAISLLFIQLYPLPRDGLVCKFQ